MSVIIRLQGLPWSANALDIRRYFQGLSIPEGGVHIVGGNEGDAFIAFSTDEDARQAMLIDTGRIKDSRVKLLLSSRVEMQKVIEAARNRNLMIQGILPAGGNTMGPALSATPPVASIPGNLGPAMPAMSPIGNMMQHGDMPPQQLNSASQQQMAYGNRMQMHQPMGPQGQSMGPMQQQYPQMTHQPMMEFGGPMDMRGGKHQMMDVNMMGPMGMQNAPNLDQGILNEGLKKTGERGGDRRDKDRDRMRDGDRERDRDRNDRDQRGRRRERSRSPPRRRNSRERGDRDRDRDRLRDREREHQRSNSRGRTTDSGHGGGMSERRAGSLGVDRAFGDNAQLRPEPFSKDIDSRHGGPDDMMGIRMPVEEPPSRHSNSMSSRTFENGRNAVGKDVEDRFGKGDMADREPVGRTPAGGRASRWNNGSGGFQEFPDGFSAQEKRQIGERGLDVEPGWDRGRRPLDGPGEFVSGGGGGGEPAAFASNSRELCVILRGLNFNVMPIQIRDLFIGLKIPNDGIVFPVDERGRRLPVALIRFSSDRDRELALKRQGKQYIGDALIEVVPCTNKEFMEASLIDGQRGSPRRSFDNPAPAGGKITEDTCIQLRGLPYSCREGDVVRFFENLDIADVIVEYDDRGRAAGSGYVEFGNPMDAKRALELTGRKIGHRYIELAPTTKEAMLSARMHVGGLPNIRGGNFPADRGAFGNEGPPQQASGPFKNNFGREEPMTDCCKIVGLPFDATDRDLLDFFSPMQVLPTAIHMMLDSNGQPSGVAFCEFSNPQDCKLAIQQNGAPMRPGSRFQLTVKAVPRREVELTLGAVGPPAHSTHPRGDVGPVNPQPRSSEARPFRAQSSPDGPPNPSFRNQQGSSSEPPGRPFQDRDRRGGSPPGSRPPRQRNHVTVESFGSPGCVVEATNLPFKSSVEDILDFFQGFGLTKDCVIRRFNDKGMPTGDARVSFHCPEDAQAAIRQLDKTSLYGRNVALHLV